MALTITPVVPPTYTGDLRVAIVDVTFDSAYATGGENLSALGELGFSRVVNIVSNTDGGRYVDWDQDEDDPNLLVYSTGVQTLTETVAKSAMTDVTVTGTKAFAGSIPAGSYVLGWKATVTSAFSGDTSAVVMVGISTDTDRFSADTAQSVFTTGTVGSFSLAADALDTAGAAMTPFVTVTSAADFTNVSSSASMSVAVSYVTPGGAQVPSLTDLSAQTFRLRIEGK